MVYFQNEYQLPPRFDAQDIIIDVGAHIGAFAFATLVRGAGHVTCIEAHPDNYPHLRSHLQDYVDSGQVTLRQGAVWRSDDATTQPLTIGAFPSIEDNLINTGGATVGDTSTGEHRLDAIALDSLIGGQSIRLLKLDCEGSEFPILLTSKRLRQVQEIVGEFHEHGDYQLAQLLACLHQAGFTTTHERHRAYHDGAWHPLPRGYFRGIRPERLSPENT